MLAMPCQMSCSDQPAILPLGLFRLPTGRFSNGKQLCIVFGETNRPFSPMPRLGFRWPLGPGLLQSRAISRPALDRSGPEARSDAGRS